MAPSPPKSTNSGKSPSVPNAPTASSKRLLPWLVAVAFFMESLDTTILNTAVPAISEALKVAPLSMKSVLASYTLEPGRFHTDQRVDGGPVRNAAGVCVGDRTFHARIFSLRHIQQHPFAGGVPHFAGLRRSHDGARGPAHFGANVCQVRTHSRDEFRGDSRAGRPDAWTDCRRIDRRIPTLAIHFLREYSDRTRRFVDGLSASARLPRENTSARYCGAHSVRFRNRAAVLCAGDLRRTYAEHRRNSGACWRFLYRLSEATCCTRARLHIPCCG